MVDEKEGRKEVYVSKREELQQILPLVQAVDTVGVDTEFIIYPNYEPKLELIQVSTPNLLAVVDHQLLSGTDGSKALVQTLLEKEWILHACTGDLGIFYRLAQRLGLERKTPKAIFDTQVAASYAGLGFQLGYGRLIEEHIGIKVDKSQSLTDWSLRPLSSLQLSYALGDVRHLFQVRDVLSQRLTELDRLNWFRDKMSELVDGALYERKDTRHAWQMVRRHKKLKPAELAVLRELASWREAKARLFCATIRWCRYPWRDRVRLRSCTNSKV